MKFPYYKRCGRCGGQNDFLGECFVCSLCKKKTFLTPHPATAVIFQNEYGEVLFVRRAVNPEKGKLDFPGGFIEVGESLEEAAVREIQEELSIGVDTLTYFCSVSDEYMYEGETIDIIGTFFWAPIKKSQKLTPQDDIDQVIWIRPEDIDTSMLAFRSLKGIIQKIIENQGITGKI